MNKCFFKTKYDCSATVYKSCPKNCPFYKTEKEYRSGIEKSKNILKNKGLIPIEKSEKGKIIVTVIKIDKS